MNQQSSRIYEFGSFQLDLTERVLLRDGQALALTPKVFETLLALIENRGRTMTKDELMQRVWPGVYVEEANLTQNISVLRKTLGENSELPRFIATVPKRGYRFVGEVRERVEPDPLVIEEHTIAKITIKPDGGEKTDEALAMSGERRPMVIWPAWLRRRKRLSSSLFAACLVGVAMMIWVVLKQPSRTNFDPQRLQFAELAAVKSRDGKRLTAGRFSPDGKMVAYVAPSEGSNLWVKQIGGSRPNRVTEGNWRDWSPVWSPDWQSLAFVSNRSNQIGIWKTPFLGGPAKLIQFLGDSELDLKGGPPLLVAWTRDGRYIYYEWNHKLFRLDLNSPGLPSAPLMNFEPPSVADQFALSPDEKQIAYVDKRDGQFDVWRVALAGGAPQRVTNDAAIDLQPIWHPDGQRLLYSSVREVRTQIFLIEAEGGEPMAVTSGDHNGPATDISFDGLSIVCQRERDESDLYAVNATSGEEQQLTSDWGVEFWPSISPDGASIAFQSIPGERFIWDPQQGTLLTKPMPSDDYPVELATNVFAIQWSPDSNQLAFLRRSGQAINLWTVPVTGGRERQLTTDGVVFSDYTYGPTYKRVQTADFCWSSDSQRLAYCSKKDGAANVWTVASDGSGQTRLSANNDPNLRLNCPLWSPNNERLAYVSESNATTMSGKQSWGLWITGQTTPVFQTEMRLRLLGWSSNDELLLALVENDGLNLALPTEVTLVVLSSSGQEMQPRRILPATYLCSTQLLQNQRNVSFITAQGGRDNIATLALDGGEMKSLTNNKDDKLYFSSLAWSRDGKTICFSKQTKWSLLTIISNQK